MSYKTNKRVYLQSNRIEVSRAWTKVDESDSSWQQYRNMANASRE